VTAPVTRAGFAALVGRPNTGKSTLVNAMVGQKIAITSPQPQTTRHVVRGVVHRPGGQVVVVDTPGVHRPRTLLGERLNDETSTAVGDVDVTVLTVPADQPVGPGDRFIAENVAVGAKPWFGVVTKSDSVSPQQVAERLLEVADLGDGLGRPFDEVLPASALTGERVELLVSLLLERLPVSPLLYDSDIVTDTARDEWVADLIREAALDGVRDELPHSIAVVVDEVVAREDRPIDRPLTDVHATLFVERDSQKGIVIGAKGGRLREVGSQARRHIEQTLGIPVFLDLHVKVAKDWQRDPRQLRRLGF